MRVELITFPFGGECSIQLSYEHKHKKRRIQESNLLELTLIGFRNQRITVLPTLQTSTNYKLKLPPLEEDIKNPGSAPGNLNQFIGVDFYSVRSRFYLLSP